MNTPRPEQPDRPIDAAERDVALDARLDAELDALLAEEAELSRQTPEDLEAKVLALTDPQMLSLLDEALAPSEVPDQLSERIVAATIPGTATTREVSERAVLARIEPSTWRYAAAAAIVLAAGVGMWWLGQEQQGDDFAEQPVPPAIESYDDLFVNTQAQPLFDDATQNVQATIQAVSDRIDGYAIDRDAIWSDMDDYEQFLTDLDT